MPSTDQAGKARSRPDPSAGDMGMAWTYLRNVSKYYEFLDTSPQRVRDVDTFTARAHTQFTQAAKLQKAIKINHRRLSHA